ncbi:MAG: outer membrane lipid asymmetry maintenance protein MlaD [Deltaproteobacteria bacterium]|nr:outer membrane lipid asymmetry maintenance protein MlaD [Deltaproteobacteria bacterium]MBW1994941.1 outer membrane lipid asymmetry maintenance protein MlaD [Deltaproteobacteria bacterium]MBW2154035.1 outer membrane lipid asymmetry maintenance protein MlaD [Deltaproteobacteria bacterium]
MKKYSNETLAGIFVLIGLLCVAYMTVKLGDVALLSDDTYSLYARFSSVSGLRVGNPVQMLGIEIGRVAGFQMDQENQVAIVELKIKNEIKVYDDAIASIKTAGLIGDRFVSIDAGGAGELLKPGDTIEETESPIEIGDLIRKYAFGDVKK